MKIMLERKHRWLTRVMSLFMALVLALMDVPLSVVAEDPVADPSENAAADDSKFENMARALSLSEFTEYSRCYATDSAFAQAHQKDTIWLNPTEAYWKLEDSGSNCFDSIGTDDHPFQGTIRINAYQGGQSLLLLTNKPLFDVVYDSVRIYQGSSATEVPIEFIRMDNTTAPLMANEVRHTDEIPQEGDSVSDSDVSEEVLANWKVILSSQTKTETINGENHTYGNFYTYGGVIGKMAEGAALSLTFTDDSTEQQGAAVSRNGAQGTLCGEMAQGASLTATYVNSTGRAITVGSGGNILTGGLVGSMKGANLDIHSAQNVNFTVNAGNSNAGLIAGYSGEGNNPEEGSAIVLADGLSFSGAVTGSSANNSAGAGGLVGKLEKSDIQVGENGAGSVTLSGVTVSGNAKIGGVIGYFIPASANTNALTNVTYSMQNCTIGGSNPGGIVGEFDAIGGENIDISKFVFSGTKLNKGSSGSTGGVFGILNGNGEVTITTGTDGGFDAPESSVHYGGVIGIYKSSALTDTLNLENLNVTNVKQTSNTQKLGGIILDVPNATYIRVNDVGVNVTGGADFCTTSNPFGGIVSRIGYTAPTDSSVGNGSFIDIVGDYKLTTSTAYNGGAIAGSFKNGVVRLAGTTDISGARTADGYGQLIYENDTTLVYAMGSGSDASGENDAAHWTFKRNDSTTASDLGQWGEVVRLFNGNNAESANIVTVDATAHTVTLASADTATAISNTTSFAKLALNMQLNDGKDHGALCFADKTNSVKTQLLQADLTVSGTIDLSGTGLLGLMRDGGNGKYLKSGDNTFVGDPDFFTGTITGENSAKIMLAVGEGYGVGSDGETLTSDATGGRIYLSENWGHDAQGLLSFGKGVTLSSLKIGGTMHVSRVSGSNHLYMAPAIGAMTNGATLTGVTITTVITADKKNDSKFYIGGVSGVFDGNDTSDDSGYTLAISGGEIKPVMTLTGTVGSDDNHDHEKSNVYAGGVLGLLKGSDATKYNVSMSNTEISPQIKLGDDVGNVNNSFIGGMIGYVKSNSTNEREISLSTVTMNSALVEQKSQYSGGLLGAFWDRTQVTIDGLTINGAKVENKRNANDNRLSGLVYRATGNWNVKVLSVSNTTFTATNNNHKDFGLIVNQGYNGNDGLYLNLRNSGYTLEYITIPTSTRSDYYVDEIVANTASSDANVVSGGNGVGIININMNSDNGTATKITGDGSTGTYQNKVLKEDKLIANSHARYYYNLDVIKAKGDDATVSEKFLMWSIYNHYAAANIKNYDVIANADISQLSGDGLQIDLRGLSYYPVNISDATLPAATYTFGFAAVRALEENKGTDSWARYPDSTGDMSKADETTRRNQHYLMQNGLFQNVTGALNTKGRITFAGDFGGVGSAGVLVGETLTGTVDLTKGVTLKGVKPSITTSPMLVNTINGEAAEVNPEFLLTGLRQEDYLEKDTQAVASALIQSAKGTGMRLVFSDIKLDARDGEAFTVEGAKSTSANECMNSAYGTSRSIFGTATFFHTLQSNSTDTIEYNYTYAEDWGTDSNEKPKRNVTYGQEVNVAKDALYPYYYKDDEEETQSGERRYYGTPAQLTNPVDDTDTWFDFSTGFLPYVGNKIKNDTYNISEMKVNFRSSGLVDGCGTYNDPYIITSGKLLTKVANYINSENAALDTIRLPNELNATWHDADKGDSEYKKNSEKYEKTDSNDSNASSNWTIKNVREYLAGAYYVISGDTITLDSTFPGIGKGGASENGKTVFHGVIVGQKSGDKYPTIKNLSVNPFIYISNGSVVKNLNFVVDNTTPPNKNKPAELLSPITITQSSSGNSALYSYQDMTASGNTTARYYGGVFGEIMGGDNIIDNVTVTYTVNRPFKLTGNNKHLIAAGGFAGAVVNGGLIFRGENSVTGFKVYRDSDTPENNALGSEDGKNLYVNPYVGRVINGYAVNEGSSDLDNTAKHYTIDKISAPTKDTDKLDVGGSTINVPNAQALFVMSLITQSTAGTAVSSDGKYGVSQSYGINNNVFCGSNHLGDYSQVGAKKIVTDESGNEKQVIYTTKSEIDDYNKKASKDVANAGDITRETAIPYIIFTYTKADGEKYPARTITYDNKKFWDIKLAEKADFDLSHYTSFRGIGCMGNKTLDYNMKIATFEGNNNTIKLSILESRYGRNAENYFHQENKSKTTAYDGELLDGSDYGHDNNLYKLMGLGLFDYVSVKCDDAHMYQFQNFTLKGNIIEKVYNSSGTDITGKDAQSQLFCIGGVVGKRIYTETSDGTKGNSSNLNFQNIMFDGLNISGAYSCGGLIGIDAFKEPLEMHIDGCNSTSNGVNITGGYYGYGSVNDNSSALRHGIGSFVGMTFWCRPYIDGKTNNIYVSKVTTHYEGSENRCNVGGLIGYSGTGAEIKNINLKAPPNSDAVIGAPNVANAAGFIGFAQTRETKNDANTYMSQSVYIENCTLENVSVKAKNSASGFYGRCNSETYGPKYIYISDSAVIGTGDTKPEIRAYGAGTKEAMNFAGGFVAGFFATYDKSTSIIQNSYISGYTIQGYHVGGMVGRKTQKPMNFRNVYVKDCDIVTYGEGSAGGFVGYSDQNLNGYNMKIENVYFKKLENNDINNELTDNTGNAGALLGMNSSDSITDHFVGVAKYHTNPAKVPTADIKTYGTNAKGLIVFADYTGQSLTESKNTENISSFGRTDNGGNITDQNKVPYLTLNPSGAMGAGEYLSGDGAYQLAENLTGYETYTSGKSAAARIYEDYSATENKPGRAFSVQMTSPIQNDNTTVSLDSFFKQGVDSSNFKISTWNREMGAKSGVDDFTMLVINDANDPEQTTNLIDNYIRLMTGTSTHYMADNSGKYCVKITPCRFNEGTNKFELQDNVTAGLKRVGTANVLNSTDGKKYTNGYYQMDLANADSLYDNQFTLIDVQYYDPTDTASKDADKRIAYHLYVPVLTRKTINIQFEAVSMPGSTYKDSDYATKIQTEITAGRNANDPSKTVNSMDAWTTSYIRFVYPRDQVDELLKLGSNLQWNHDKKVSIVRTTESNIPNTTKLVLIDSNNNADKVYYAVAGDFGSDDVRVIDFSQFKTRANGTGDVFHEQTLYSMVYDKLEAVANNAGKGAYTEVNSKTSGCLTVRIDGTERYFVFAGSSGNYDLKAKEDIIENYYLSLYVPKEEGQADVVQIQPAGTMGAIGADGAAATGTVIRATVTPRLNTILILGEFIKQEELGFALSSTANAGNVISDNNKILTAASGVKISLLNTSGQAEYFAGILSDNSVHLYHSFNIRLLKHETASSETDIIQGIERNNINAGYSVCRDAGRSQVLANGSAPVIRDTNYIQCTTGDIKNYLIDKNNGYQVYVFGAAEMDFTGYQDEFPVNSGDVQGIGVQGAVKSNLAYRESELPYAKMTFAHDPVDPFYYIKEDNRALFTFDAVDELDEEEIGANTQNMSRVGVNDYFVYDNMIHGKAVYNVTEVSNYSKASQIKYTLELYRKTTENGVTTYQKVENITDYLTDVILIDSDIMEYNSDPGNANMQAANLVKSNDSTGDTYIYTRNLNWEELDKDAVFYADFSCNVLKDEVFAKKEYANYKIMLSVELLGAENNAKTSYIIYTNAKINPAMIDGPGT